MNSNSSIEYMSQMNLDNKLAYLYQIYAIINIFYRNKFIVFLIALFSHAFVRSLSFFLIVIYIAIRKFISFALSLFKFCCLRCKLIGFYTRTVKHFINFLSYRLRSLRFTAWGIFCGRFRRQQANGRS